MKKRLLLTTLVATMVASTLLVGCGGKEEDKNNNTTTPATKVEEGETKDADNSTNVDSGAKEEETSYVEKWEDEPDWEAKYEGIKKYQMEERKKSEEEAESYAQFTVDNEKLQYDAMKFVFEDMTQNFKYKKEVTPIDGVYVYGITTSGEIPSFVCDIANIIPEDTEIKIYDRESYKEFGGFDALSTEFFNKSDDGSKVLVDIYANRIDVNGKKVSPMFVKALLNRKEDGTFVYDTIEIGYDIEPTEVNN